MSAQVTEATEVAEVAERPALRGMPVEWSGGQASLAGTPLPTHVVRAWTPSERAQVQAEMAALTQEIYQARHDIGQGVRRAGAGGLGVSQLKTHHDRVQTLMIRHGELDQEKRYMDAHALAAADLPGEHAEGAQALARMAISQGNALMIAGELDLDKLAVVTLAMLGQDETGKLPAGRVLEHAAKQRYRLSARLSAEFGPWLLTASQHQSFRDTAPSRRSPEVGAALVWVGAQQALLAGKSEDEALAHAAYGFAQICGASTNALSQPDAGVARSVLAAVAGLTPAPWCAWLLGGLSAWAVLELHNQNPGNLTPPGLPELHPAPVWDPADPEETRHRAEGTFGPHGLGHCPDDGDRDEDDRPPLPEHGLGRVAGGLSWLPGGWSEAQRYQCEALGRAGAALLQQLR